ncbi:MAG: putative PEP-binding protein, partial [Leptospirales bacterium]
MAMKEIRYRGKTGFAGIAIGKLSFVPSNKISSYSSYRISDPLTQIAITKKAFAKALNEIEERIVIIKGHSSDAFQVFSAHREILKDVDFFQNIATVIEKNNIEAGEAIREITEKYITTLRQSPSEIFQEKAWDVEDIQNLLLMYAEREFENKKQVFPDLLWTSKVTPHQVFDLKNHSVRGFALNSSSSSSHDMIIAKALQIPCVYAIKPKSKTAIKDAPAIIDAEEGIVILYPSEKTLKKYQDKRSTYSIGDYSLSEKRKWRKSLENLPDTFNMADGKKINIQINLDFTEELTHFPRNKLKEIGLCRSEFLFHNDSVIDREIQQKKYSLIVQYLNEKSVVFRLFDLTEEKTLPTIDPESFKKSGLNSIRFLLDEKSLLISQIEALVGASGNNLLKILLPMVTLVDEVLEIKELIENISRKMGKPRPPIGVMVETPAAIDLMPELNSLVDFYSVGTNDLLQFLTATDRDNIRLRHIYNPFHETHIKALERIYE